LHELFDNLNSDHVFPVAEKIMEAFVSKEYDVIEIVYNQFKNAAVQEVVVEQFLPVLPPSNNNSAASSADYIFEPAKDEIVQSLIPKSLKTQFYKTLLDSFAAEHGARMTAMHKATDNAAALLKELKISYNKARQASITNEILEIVGGAEALNA
jgi:F-type H+-transporting ATPase subunit gamma